MNQAPAAIGGACGKLPLHGDFIRFAEAPVVEALDAIFLAGNIDQDRHHDLVAAFDRCPPALAVLPAGGRLWAAAIWPSRDRVGRRSPFSLLCSTDLLGMDDEVGILPYVFAPFFQRAFGAAQAGWPEQLDGVRRLAGDCAQVMHPSAAGELLSETLGRIPLAEIWSALLGSADDPRRAKVIALIHALAGGAAWRQGAPCGLRISPTPNQGHGGFWTTLLWLARAVHERPALLVLHPPSEARPASTTILWGHPTPEQRFAAIWPGCAPASFGSAIVDLVGECEAALPVNDSVQGILGEVDASARDALHALVTARRTERYRRKA